LKGDLWWSLPGPGASLVLGSLSAQSWRTKKNALVCVSALVALCGSQEGL
jgi:hypothetical protein